MAQQPRPASPALNPLVQDLLAEGGGKVLVIGGFVGQTRDDHIRLYSDLTLRKYIEIAKADIVRVVETPDKPERPSIVYFKITAELKYVQEASFRADQAVAAMVSICCGCSAQSNATGIAAAQSTGGGGMPDLCEMNCLSGAANCLVQAGGPNAPSWRKLWCGFDYLMCRLGCFLGDLFPTPT
ncbi:hypothetical protein [Bradyrhizobium cenepequi]|jgi:hypothetical protein